MPRGTLGNRPMKGEGKAAEPARAGSVSTKGVRAKGLVWEEL